MSELIAITFDGADDATQALASVRPLENEGRIGLEDTAVVTKDADGKVHVKNEMASGTETGAVVGARPRRRCCSSSSRSAPSSVGRSSAG